MKLIRWMVGRILLFLNRISLPKSLEREESEQAKVEEELKNYQLYEFEACPFCIKVRRTLRRLNLPMERRDVKRNHSFELELKEKGGKVMVPCLKMTQGDSVKWMYESKDIVAFLEDKFRKANPSE